ncbi:tRNA (guanosine(46)-N7)-methyltransferase TrmB [Phototrophicus methaneseepsis]|uniref:tRNA (guanine-N(7)-)-methyltransferase n=1 Tax=Phototrophicus methaneseepsis TaxID=2710758 RepID=A0A7S8EDS7_9CHLR|nr:tRNA (guanosine(46)-N7)-methyltransferase TrmB [Phototrophicus methaneseepsis]QPC84994.1 tRNA (guanosine(46)-N7)-methyltransferase TrmB [Phototrophicus methaneseepsis]
MPSTLPFQHRKLSTMTLPWPVDWTALFGTVRPLILEIGFGNGDYLLHLARQHPDYNVIGVEISNKSLEKAEQKIINSGLPNVCAIHGRGETALHHLFASATISQIHVNYPDPWFKSRHAGRRLIQRDTLDAIVSRLVPGGIFYLATDILDYAEMAHELLADTRSLTNQQSVPWADEMPGRIITKYEQKGYQEGRPGHFFVYQRNEIAGPDVPVMQELEMPHIVLQTPLTPDDMLEKFDKMTHHIDDIHVAYLEAFMDHRRRALLFEIKMQEPTIDQHFCLTLTPREDGDYTLIYATIGNPRPTLGMHIATGHLGDWLASLHPDAQVVSRKVKEA